MFILSPSTEFVTGPYTLTWVITHEVENIGIRVNDVVFHVNAEGGSVTVNPWNPRMNIDGANVYEVDVLFGSTMTEDMRIVQIGFVLVETVSYSYKYTRASFKTNLCYRMPPARFTAPAQGSYIEDHTGFEYQTFNDSGKYESTLYTIGSNHTSMAILKVPHMEDRIQSPLYHESESSQNMLLSPFSLRTLLFKVCLFRFTLVRSFVLSLTLVRNQQGHHAIHAEVGLSQVRYG